MSVSDQPIFISYTTDGVTTNFAVPFYFTAFSDLIVMLNGVVKTLGTDYFVTGTLDPKLNVYNAGGTVVFPIAAPPASETLFILRSTPKTQPYVFAPQDPFPAGSNEASHDRETLIIQEIAGNVGCKGVLPDVPTSGAYNTGDWIRNANPTPGGYFGWVFISGSWYAFGLISLTAV